MRGFLGLRPAPRFAPPAPAGPLYAVGDLHGRADLLPALLERIDADARGAAATTVFLGDYVDRGEASRTVLERLMRRARAAPGRTVCLMGNHERMMLDALDRPAARGPLWLRNGGVETLASFGVPEPSGDWEGAAAALRAALPPGMEAWLRALPLTHRSGDVVCVHAALDPARAPDDQEPRTLLWGTPRFFRTPRRDGIWVVHGHTIVEAPSAERGRVAVDTGAWYSGRLTAAALFPGAPVRFLEVTG